MPNPGPAEPDFPPVRGEEEEEAPGPARKVLARRVNAVGEPEQPVAAEIARLSDARRDELAARELRQQDMQKFSELLRAAVERLQASDGPGGEAWGGLLPAGHCARLRDLVTQQGVLPLALRAQ